MSLLRVKALEVLEGGIQFRSLWRLPSQVSTLQPGSVRYDSQSGEFRVYTGGDQWHVVGQQPSTSLYLSSDFTGEGTSSSPLALRSSLGGFLSRVVTDSTLLGDGTLGNPLRVNTAALPTSGLTAVVTDDTLLGNGTAANVLRVKVDAISLPLLSEREVTGSRSFVAEDAGKHCVYRGNAPVTLMAGSPFPFADGRLLYLSHRGSPEVALTLQGQVHGFPFIYRGESAAYLAYGGNLVPVSPTVRSGRRLRVGTLTATRFLQFADAGGTWVCQSGTVRLRMPATHPFLPGQWLRVVATGEAAVEVEGVETVPGTTAVFTVRRGQALLISDGQSLLILQQATLQGSSDRVAVVSSSRSLTAADAGLTLLCAGGVTLTVPSTHPFAAGQWVQVVATGSGAVTLAGTVSGSLQLNVDVVYTGVFSDTVARKPPVTRAVDYIAHSKAAFLVSDGSRMFAVLH